MSVVLDASLIVALVVADERQDAARTCLDGWLEAGTELHAPSVLPYEVANVLARLVFDGALEIDEVTEIWHDRVLDHHPDPTPGTGPGPGVGPQGWRMIHRLYLPMSTCTDIPALAEDPFRTPGEVYALLAGAGWELRFTEHVQAATPTPDDTTTLAPGGPVLITRRVATTPDQRPVAMEETRRSATGTQLSYHQNPIE